MSLSGPKREDVTHELGQSLSFNELVLGDGALHVEALDARHVWLRARGSDGKAVDVNIIWKRGGKVVVRVVEDL